MSVLWSEPPLDFVLQLAFKHVDVDKHTRFAAGKKVFITRSSPRFSARAKLRMDIPVASQLPTRVGEFAAIPIPLKRQYPRVFAVHAGDIQMRRKLISVSD